MRSFKLRGAQYAEPWRTATLVAPEDIVLLADQGRYLAPARKSWAGRWTLPCHGCGTVKSRLGSRRHRRPRERKKDEEQGDPCRLLELGCLATTYIGYVSCVNLSMLGVVPTLPYPAQRILQRLCLHIPRMLPDCEGQGSRSVIASSPTWSVVE
jgi:hypothetical protein